MAMAPSVPQHNSVNGAERMHVLGEIVEVRNDSLLAGMCDVEAREPHSLGLREQFWKRADVELHPVQIDKLVDAANAVFRCFELMHCRRTRRLNAGPNKAETCCGTIL